MLIELFIFLIMLLVATIFFYTSKIQQYDERQQAVRNRGYKYAFMTVFFLDAFFLIISFLVDFPQPSLTLVTSIIFSMGVCIYSVYTIWHHSFLTVKDNNAKKWSCFYFIAGIFELIALFTNPGSITRALFGPLAVVFIIIGGLILYRYYFPGDVD